MNIDLRAAWTAMWRSPGASTAPLAEASGRDTATTQVPGWGFWERALATAVFLALVSPAVALLGVAIHGAVSSNDLAKLIPVIQGGFWPLLVFFTIVIWRREVPQLISRLRRAGPKGLEFAETKLAKGAESLRTSSATGGAKRRLPRPEPDPNAQDVTAGGE